MIIVDGQKFDIKVLSLTRTAEFLHSYAMRTMSGDLKKKLIGVFYNYELTLGSGKDYNLLYEKLTEAQEFHKVEVFYNDESFVFQAYFDSVSDTLKKRVNGEALWGDLSVSFIAKEPAKRPEEEVDTSVKIKDSITITGNGTYNSLLDEGYDGYREIIVDI